MKKENEQLQAQLNRFQEETMRAASDAKKMQRELDDWKYKYQHDICLISRQTTQKRHGENESCQRKTAKAERIMIFSAFIYGIMVTCLKAFQTPCFKSECIEFVQGLWTGIKLLEKVAETVALKARGLEKVIPWQRFGEIMSFVLACVIFAAIFVGVLAIISFAVHKIMKYVISNFWDVYSLMVVLVSFAVVVWFSDCISRVGLNLIILWIVINALYLLVRGCVINYVEKES